MLTSSTRDSSSSVYLQDRLAHVDARRADDDVDAVLRVEIVEDPIDRGRIADIERPGLAGTSVADGTLRDPARGVLVDVEADDARALLRAAERDGFADTRGPRR